MATLPFQLFTLPISAAGNRDLTFEQVTSGLQSGNFVSFSASPHHKLGQPTQIVLKDRNGKEWFARASYNRETNQLFPAPTHEQEPEYINYDEAAYKLKKGDFVRFYADPKLQDVALKGDTILTFVNAEDQEWQAEVGYDAKTNQISPPRKAPGPIIVEFSSPYEHEDSFDPYISMAEPEEEISKQLNPNEIVIPMQVIKVEYNYPLGNPVTFEHTSADPRGFTRAELARKISEGYQRIYREEDEAVLNAGKTVENIPGMLNRQETEGPYGIWGHGIGDLLLTTVIQKQGNLFEISVDS